MLLPKSSVRETGTFTEGVYDHRVQRLVERAWGDPHVQRKPISYGVIGLLAVVGLSLAASAMAQRAPVLVRAAIAGDVVASQLVQPGQTVKQGDPLVFVKPPTRTEPALAAVSPVDGRVTRVSVHPGSHVNIGDIVVVIQPQ
jgi:multidrug efflux pump subunit AcrA (membrane-fusion protein)